MKPVIIICTVYFYWYWLKYISFLNIDENNKKSPFPFFSISILFPNVIFIFMFYFLADTTWCTHPYPFTNRWHHPLTTQFVWLGQLSPAVKNHQFKIHSPMQKDPSLVVDSLPICITVQEDYAL